MPQGLNAPKQNLEDEEALDACVQTDARWKQSTVQVRLRVFNDPPGEWTTPGHGARNHRPTPHARAALPWGADRRLGRGSS